MTETLGLSSGARYEFYSAQYPEDSLSFQAVDLIDGTVGLSLLIDEGGASHIAEFVLRHDQLPEFGHAVFAALERAALMSEAKYTDRLLGILRRGIVDNPAKAEDGS